jgi:predicted permease
MRRLRTLWRTLFRRADIERQMADELSFHIDARTTDLMSRLGLSRAEAIRQARIEFGSVEKYKDEGRASLGLRLIDEFRGDFRFARRALIKNLGFSTAAIVILAFGIGANTAVFSVVDALLLGTLPVNDPQDLVAFDTLQTRDSMVAGYSGSGRPGPGGTARRTSFPMATFERFREHATTLSHVFAFAPIGSVAVVADDSAELASAQLVSGSYFEGMGVPAVMGRILGPADDRADAEPAAVVSHRYWQRRFFGDAAIVGKTIRVNRTAFTIVGVTPETFHGTDVTESIDLSVPLAMSPHLSPTGGPPRSLSTWWLLLMGRLKPGVTREQVFAELQPIFKESVLTSWNARDPATRNPSRTGMPVLRVLSGSQGPDGPSPNARASLTYVFVIAGVVLLIACVNVASLLLVRAANRRQEMTVRLALGASRARLIRQLLTESLLLAAAGAAGGLAFAWWGKDALPRMFEDDVVLATAIDLRGLAFAGVLTAVTTLVFGVGHALRATRVGAMPWLKETARPGGQRALMARTLIGVQIAASLVLLVVAGLFIRTLHNYSRVDVGFDTRNLLVFQLDPTPSATDSGSVVELYERLLGQIEAVPGVRSATLSALPVVARSEWTDTIRAERNETAREVHIQVVRWNFFQTLGMPLVAGRSLEATDIGNAPRVAVINAAMARAVFDEDLPIGQRFQFVNGPGRNMPIEVVGVVRDAKYSRLSEPEPSTFFMPYTQFPSGRMTVEIRTTGDALALTSVVRAAIRRIDPGLPLIDVRTQDAQIRETLRNPRTFAALTAVSGAIGLLLACIGLYGVVSYDARRRTSEIGVRMALGAERSDVLRLVMGQTSWVVATGVGVGLILAGAGARLLSDQLFGVQPFDISTMASATLLLVVIAGLAVLLPARRAARLDPTQALRHE